MFIRVQQATARADREEVFRFRYRLMAEGAGLLLPEPDHARAQATDALDEHARILVAVDEASGAILGTLRCNLGKDHPLPRELVARLALDSMQVAFGDAGLACMGAFVVEPAYRGLTVASSLLGGLFDLLLDEDVALLASLVELSQARTWFQIGFRPYGPPARYPAAEGLQLPIVLVVRDRGYLTRLGSPLAARMGPREPDRAIVAARLADLYPDFRDQGVAPPRPAELWASVAHASADLRVPSLFEGIDRDRLEPLLRGLTSRVVRANESLSPQEGSVRGMGLLLRGRLGVTAEAGERPFYTAVLHPGEVFGELGDFVTSGRAAVLRALDDSEVLALPADLIERLGTSDPPLAARLRANLAEITAARLDALGRQVAGFMRGSPERVLVEEAPPVAEVVPLPPPVGGARRRGEQVELDLLARVGLGRDGVLLDLGAGDGTSTLLLARAFPEASVVGVEPDAARRARAEARAEQAGLEDRCTFLAGAGERIPLDAGAVDGAWARFVFQEVPEPVDVLRELARVVRPGGRIAVLDVDDSALLVHPEPPGFAGFQARVAAAQASLGGDRHVGRKLAGYLAVAGLQGVRAELVSFSSEELPIAALAEQAFAFREGLLTRAGLWRAEDDRTLAALRDLDAEPGAWLAVGLVLAWGTVPEPRRVY
ncbi:MAG: methyltransferase domain-containing protein [Pseudomonadota bacterium]